MAGNIKGIKIEIGGDTQPLQASLNNQGEIGNIETGTSTS